MKVIIPKYLKTPFFLSVFITLALFLIVISSYFKIQNEIPIFYSLAQKSDQLGAKAWLFLFPSISFAITSLHFVILLFLPHLGKTTIRLFAGATVLVQVLLATSLIRIIFVIS